VLEALIQAGAFDLVQLQRARLLAGLEGALDQVQSMKRLQAARQMSMFAGLSRAAPDDWLPEVPEWEESVKLAREKEALGVYLTGHPLDAYRGLLKSRCPVTTADLPEVPDSQEVALGVVVTGFTEKVGKKGGRLAILTVEDLAGSAEAVVYSDLYDRAAPLLQRPSLPLWLRATVVQEEKGPKLVAQDIIPLEGALPQWPERLDLHLQAAGVTREQLLKLKEVLALPPELSLTPSPDLADEVNRVLGYPALSL